MPQSNLTPLSVVPYGQNYIVDFVRHKTGWSERNEVSNKTQLTYLCRYLKENDCKTIVVEYEYIDKHFLEDYAEYYARCFPPHPRKCSRLHFFNFEFDQHDFIQGLTENDSVFSGKLNIGYIGYAVIRPIPHTFFAKICLKPYKSLSQREGARILTNEIKVSLFGIPLKVETIPFIEQDKVVAACATSALWMYLSVSNEAPLANLPSPSAITKSASHVLYEGNRTFPTAGLTKAQVARSLRHYGLDPTTIELNLDSQITELKETIYAYINNGSPVILGGDVYETNPIDGAGGQRYLGKHLICIVGYSTDTFGTEGQWNLSSHKIDKIYVHDDRIGPYVKIGTKCTPHMPINGKKIGYTLQIDVDLHERNIFVPDVAIIGLNQKVRILYPHIRAICETLHQYLQLTVDDICVSLNDEQPASISINQEIRNEINNLLIGVWDISLVSNTVIKEELRKSNNFCTFNGIVNKKSLLLQNLPKHIWRCRIKTVDVDGEAVSTDILFDATEVPQGSVLVGYISYGRGAQRVWGHVEANINDRIWQRYSVDSNLKGYIGCFFKFFAELQGRTYLNSLYGPLTLPSRSLKSGEADTFNDIVKRSDVHVIRRGNSLATFGFLVKSKEYIWVINEHGDLVIGEDIKSGGEFKGHPTLIDGKPGRVAGELSFKHETGIWEINSKSGAYSGHIRPGSDEAIEYVNAVKQHNFGTDFRCEIATY